jgi:hypothetical protein
MLVRLRAGASRISTGLLRRMGVARTGKLTVAGALIVFVVMTAVALLSAARTEQRIESARAASRASHALNHIIDLIVAEHEALDDFLIEPNSKAQQRFETSLGQLGARSARIRTRPRAEPGMA